MSGENNSPFPSGVSNGQKLTTWRRPCNEPITNESSANVGSDVPPSLPDSIRSSSQCSYSNAAPPVPPTLNHNSDTSSNARVFQNDLLSNSLRLPNGSQKPYHKEEINNLNFSRDDTHSQGGCGYLYNQDRRHEQWSNSYRGSTGCMPPCMQFSREQPRPYMVPMIYPPMHLTFISNVIPFNWYSTYEVPNVIPVCPQLQYLCWPNFIPYQGFYAALQSNFSFLLLNLRANLRKQIEYYFSSENLYTDHYLKKQMDDHGWVPVTLIAQFRRVQRLMDERQSIYDSFRLWSFMEMQVMPLADDIQFILDSLRLSYFVEVQGNKVRKRHEWDKWVSHS
ncbi:la-related protein 1B-like [Phalaenopsis equestris]|uniref:la-related protein 1B-like n=1 Tax=Phalaenopsis equestris TaxID=78828 RepID=UPI0009E321D8|nr:la-related protein 1B-like [Phalaenopsis equestris]